MLGFIKRLAQRDRATCDIAHTPLSPEWTGEHTTALAEYIGAQPSERTLKTAAAQYAYLVEHHHV